MYDVIFNSGFIGFLIWLLLFATSTAGLALVFRCAWILRRKRFMAAGFADRLTPLLKEGDWQGAYDACGSDHAIAADIARSVLTVAHSKHKAARQELAVAMLDKAARAVLRQINSLAMCGNIAPMLGLLGTVTGMVDAFVGLGTTMGPEKASVLAIAISQALYTTAAGLLVAVPAIALSTIFRNLLEKRLEAVTEFSTLLLDTLPELPAAPEPPPAGNFHRTETRKLNGV
jgi:biopolymer transport protein ExbB